MSDENVRTVRTCRVMCCLPAGGLHERRGAPGRVGCGYPYRPRAGNPNHRRGRDGARLTHFCFAGAVGGADHRHAACRDDYRGEHGWNSAEHRATDRDNADYAHADHAHADHLLDAPRRPAVGAGRLGCQLDAALCGVLQLPRRRHLPALGSQGRCGPRFADVYRLRYLRAAGGYGHVVHHAPL